MNIRKQQKLLRDHGKEAKTRKGKIIPAKQFQSTGNCCRKRCFEKISEEQQKEYHQKFYECSKEGQNQILAGGITISNKSGERKGRGTITKSLPSTL